jgi:hypothetical protein
VQVRLGFIHDHFIAVIKVKSVIPGRQLGGKGPVPIAQINELVRRNIIVALDIRNIIIFHMIVSGGTP